VQKEIIADQNLQGKHTSLNEATNMDVEETGSVSNATQNGSKEDERNVEGKAKVASVFEKLDKVMENYLKEHINADNELSKNKNGNMVKSVVEEGEQVYITNSMEVVVNSMKERIFGHSIRKPIDTQQVIELQDMEDWTYWNNTTMVINEFPINQIVT
jgi:hypothetical protein